MSGDIKLKPVATYNNLSTLFKGAWSEALGPDLQDRKGTTISFGSDSDPRMLVSVSCYTGALGKHAPNPGEILNHLRGLLTFEK